MQRKNGIFITNVEVMEVPMPVGVPKKGIVDADVSQGNAKDIDCSKTNISKLRVVFKAEAGTVQCACDGRVVPP